MIDKVYRYMKSCHMIPPGRRILVAVSGGADSMCLLEVLRELQERTESKIRVLHVHHGLRESAEDDLQYVAKYCKDARIPFQAVRVDAAGYAAANGLSVEEAARHLRYEALEKAAKEWDQDSALEKAAKEWDQQPAPEKSSNKKDQQPDQCRIAVAHHIEDQSETVLFNLVRGSRLTGLRGMLPVNGRIIRPLLCCSREEIESYLMERGITWREDETNEDVRYSRNLIRKQVMPLLLSINKGAREHIMRVAEEAAEAESYLSAETEHALKRCCVQGRNSKQGQEIVIHIPSLLEEPPLLQRRVVYAAIAEASGRKKDLQDVHVQAVLGLCRKQGNGELDVAGGVHVTKVYERLYLSPGTGAKAIMPETKAGLPDEQAIKPETKAGRSDKPVNQPEAKAGLPDEPANQSVNEGGLKETPIIQLTDDPFTQLPTEPEAYACRVFDFDGDMDAVPRKQYTKWLDYDKIGELPIFRTRRAGDRITLDEYGRSKSIARYMIDRKVPAQLRERIVMPTCGSEILWVPGGRISAAYMVSTDTKRILEIHWDPAGNAAK